MEKEKIMKNNQDADKRQKARRLMSIFAVVKNEQGEEKEVDMREIVGSKKR